MPRRAILITEDHRDQLLGLLATAKKRLKRDRRYLGMFEDELARVPANPQARVTELGAVAEPVYRLFFPRSAGISAGSGTPNHEGTMETKVRTMLITKTDIGRLRLLLHSAKKFLTKNHNHLVLLEEELERAEVVSPEKIPPEVITMNSQVRIHDLDAGRQAVYTLVFPGDADVAKNRISVFAPFGTALLGNRVGDLVECAARGAKKRLRVKGIVSQPDAARHIA